MTTMTTGSSPATPPDQRVVPVLAVGEARRLLTHPVMLTGLALWVFVSGNTLLDGDRRPLDVFEAVSSALSWVPGLFAILAAYLVATREQRAGTLDVLGSLPAREPERVRALCLASLAAGLLALVLNLGLAAALLAQDAFYEAPSIVHLLQGPLTVVGAVLFGVLLAVWAPVALSPALGVVAMVALHVAADGERVVGLLVPTVFWADWGRTEGQLWEGYIAGSTGWHDVYVAGLCGLAATAALVRVTPRPRGTVVLGLAALAVTLVGAFLQLP
jgi:hypothetical protein